LHFNKLQKTTTIAKKIPDSIIDLLRSIEGKTLVRSNAYGYHLRAKRGTHKKAVLNHICKRQTKELVKTNDLARIIKTAIDPYRSPATLLPHSSRNTSTGFVIAAFNEW
jgi:hypothetical protein